MSNNLPEIIELKVLDPGMTQKIVLDVLSAQS